MQQTRLGAVILLFAAAGLAKSPTDTSTVCDRYQQSDLIFTGSAETTWITLLDTRKSPIHKRSEKSKRVRFLVREWYKGKRRDTVEVWFPPADCPLKIEANQTYLLYAHLNKDNGRTESTGCMGTVPVASAASDILYLTAAQLGPDHATRIFGNAGTASVNVLAQSGIDKRYAIADANGQFVFDGLKAGEWNLSPVGAAASKPVQLTPNSCVMVDLSAQ
jgi:hypothetical protein